MKPSIVIKSPESVTVMSIEFISNNAKDISITLKNSVGFTIAEEQDDLKEVTMNIILCSRINIAIKINNMSNYY